MIEAGSKVFLSYVHEDREIVERLVNSLKPFGVDVWWDRDRLMPGERWVQAIRRGIADGDFFVACFSVNFGRRTKTYMNEELTLAIAELRQRPTHRAWFIPVLLAPCKIPDRDIGPGETLGSLQSVSLYEDWDEGISKLLSVIQPDTTPIYDAIRALDNPSARAQIRAADDLGKMGRAARTAVDKLIRALDSENDTVTAAAADALGSIGFVTEDVLVALLRKLQQQRFFWSLYSRKHIRCSLAKLMEADPKRTVPWLITCIIHGKSDESSASLILRSSVTLCHEATVFIVCSLSAQTIPKNKQWIHMLGDLGDSASIPSLMKLLTDETEDVRVHAGFSLGNFATGHGVRDHVVITNDLIKAVPIAIHGLTDTSPEVRKGAAYALVRISKRFGIEDRGFGPETPRSALSRALMDDSADVRDFVARMLREFNDNEQLK